MDPYVAHANEHLSNFSQFAGKFAKVFIPIVDTAIKMSAEEPVSAYGVFKAAKELSNSNKKYKKNQNGSTIGNNTNKRSKVKKTGSKAAGKSRKHEKSWPTEKRTKNHSKQTKAARKKKTNSIELQEESGESNDIEYSAGSDLYAGECTTNEDDMFPEDETNENGYLSNNDNEHQLTEDLAQAILNEANRKRKMLELDENKIKSAAASNKETKKIKKDEVAQGTSSKFLPAAISCGLTVEDSKKIGIPLNSLDDIKKKKVKKTPQNIVSTTANVQLKSLSPPENVVTLNSIEEGKRVFKWLLNPVTVEDFFAMYWEQKACLIKRQQDSYFGNLISFESIDQMLLQNHVEFTKNIDVTSYKNGVRETLNPEGRALPPVVWDHYGQGCSIRLLNPQTFLPALYTLSSTMQEYFHCLVGANAYLTPANSQGFAPHYDDIEAFVLQIEGRKRWKLYKPCRTADILPRYSSHNFNQEEIGKPVLEVVLQPGDVLYFPRGTIHQASTEPGYHSLHITLSVYQKQSFADLFEKMLPLMLQEAIANNLDLRRGLPLYAFQHAGIANSDKSTKERADLTETVTQLMHKCIRKMPLQDIMDAGIDQLAKKFQHEALPPEILPAEKLRTVFGSRSHTNKRGECVCDYDIDERTNVRLLRANILRLVYEEKKIRIYYYADNSKQYCEYEPNFIEIEAGEAASVELLIKYYPQYVGVSQLPMPTDEQKINLVTALWERGLLMMEKPFR